jgi:hypothetical protein
LSALHQEALEHRADIRRQSDPVILSSPRASGIRTKTRCRRFGPYSSLWATPTPSNSTRHSSHIQRDPSRLKAILAAPAFTAHFGAPHPSATGERQSIFGRDDELKNAPKNVARDHPEIALLRLRTFAVAHRFTDEEVFEEAFAERVGEVAEVMRPFVHW